MNWSDKHTWKQSFLPTFICLAGCSIGAMGIAFYLIGYNWFLVLSISLVAGFITCMIFMMVWHLLFLKMNLKDSFRSSYTMSLVPIFIMIVAENIILLLMTPEFSTHEAHMKTANGLGLMLFAMSCGFILAMPYNYYQLQKTGKACHDESITSSEHLHS